MEETEKIFFTFKQGGRNTLSDRNELEKELKCLHSCYQTAKRRDNTEKMLRLISIAKKLQEVYNAKVTSDFLSEGSDCDPNSFLGEHGDGKHPV